MSEKNEILKTAHEYIINLKNGIKKMSNEINEGKEREGIKLIPLIAEGIDWLCSAINLTKNVHKEKIDLKDINNILMEIVDALENEDYVLVSDLFSYEITPILNRIYDELGEYV